MSWAQKAMLIVAIGFGAHGVFFAIGAFVEISPAKQTLGNTWMSVEGDGGKVLVLSGSAMFRMRLASWYQVASGSSHITG